MPSSTFNSNSGAGLRLLVAKAAVYALLVAVLWLAVAVSTGHTEVPPVLKEVHRAAAADVPILFLGDSSTFATAPKESDLRSVPHFLGELLPDARVSTVLGQAHTPLLHAEALEAVLRRGARPRLVIVCVNPRAFSPVWDLYPAWQFTKEILLLRNDSFLLRAFFHPLAVFQAFNPRPVSDAAYLEAFTAIFADNGRPIPKGVPDHLARDDFFFASYCAPIDEQGRQVEALRKVSRVAAVMEARVLFYVPPVDLEAGTALLGPQAGAMLGANIARLEEAVAAAHVDFLDCSRLLPSPHFPGGVRNEHLDWQGRRRLARRLAEAIQAGPIRNDPPQQSFGGGTEVPPP